MDYNVRGTALASAARTATTTSGEISAKRSRGLIVYLNCTAASGTGGLAIIVRGRDDAGNTYALHAAGTLLTATGTRMVVVYPSTLAAVGAIQAVSQCPVPLAIDIQVTHGDASSYTYSVSYELVR